MGLDQHHGPSLLWTANTLETVSGFEAVALLVVPIELVGIFLAADLVGAVAKRLGVRQPAAADVSGFAAYGHRVWSGARSFHDSCHGASVQPRQWGRKTRIRASNSEVKQVVEPLYHPWSIVDSFSSAAIEPQDREEVDRVLKARQAIFHF